MDRTHSPSLKSWVESANLAGMDFPIQNLPFCVFRLRDSPSPPRVGVAIGHKILDVSLCLQDGLFNGQAAAAAEKCDCPSLNALMALDRRYCSALRQRLSELLDATYPGVRKIRKQVERSLVDLSSVELGVPVDVGDYTDFYASLHHATHVGSMFRPNSPLMPNYKYVPIGYHGRTSSIVASGTDIRRPRGQVLDDGSGTPAFRPSQLLDYEAEVGLFVGPGNSLGSPLDIREADDHMFGLCLVNDWSARDIQAWEYQPLGPFLGKNFATTISPWVVTMDALEPFRVPAARRPATDPQPLPYLSSPEDRQLGGIDVYVEVFLRSEQMRRHKLQFVRLSRGRFKEMYWTLAQLLTHHTSNGCNLRPGDLLASGTVSGNAEDSRGCLLELTRRGSMLIRLPGGEKRGFLQDGDEVLMRGFCARRGYRKIGFGECRGRVVHSGSSGVH